MTVELDTLAVRAQTGAPRDIDAFLCALRPILKGTAHKILLWHEEPEDVMQWMTLEVLSALPKFHPRNGTAASYFAHIAHRVLLARYRVSKRFKLTLLKRSLEGQRARRDKLLDLEDSTQRPERLVEERWLQEAAGRALVEVKLTRRQREVLGLVFRDGLTHAEAARVLGIHKGALWTIQQQGLRRLRPAMEEWL